LHGNKYPEYFCARQMVIVSGTLTFVWVQASRLNRQGVNWVVGAGFFSIIICKLLMLISRNLADLYNHYYQHIVDNQMFMRFLRTD